MRSFHFLTLLGLAACAPAPHTTTPVALAASTAEACQPRPADSTGVPQFTPPHSSVLVAPPVPMPGGEARGKTYVADLFVDASGAVIPDSTTITPTIHDRQFDRQFRAVLARIHFRPAMRDGCPAAAWAKQTYTFIN